MATVTYNGQSFSIDGRRQWILGAAIQYSRVPREQWPDRIAAAQQAGFNTIQTACPWMIHEPRRGRFDFEGPNDVRHFVKLCQQAHMKVILRAGPFVGSQYDGGGLPSWLMQLDNVALREANETFLEHVTRYLRKLLGELSDLQVTKGGPIFLVQSEHAWLCANEEQADKYLKEVTRIIRESGITVPITNANDLWQESPGTIDTWRGWDDLLVHLRQLRSVRPDAPRLVSAFEPASFDIWGDPPRTGQEPLELMQSIAEVLAAGAQFVVAPFHGGTNFDFLGGRVAGRPDGFVTTSAAPGAPLGEAGQRTGKYNVLKRLVTFANHFSHVFAELDPDYQPVTMDADDLDPSEPDGRSRAKTGRTAIVPLRGGQGRVVFIFAEGAGRKGTMILEDGLRLPFDLGEQPVGWFLLDADLRGAGRMDYANVLPWAVVGRSIVVMFGPARARAMVSIMGYPVETTLPSGGKPQVLEHRGLTLVLCNEEQIDTAYHDQKSVYIGISGLDEHGKPILKDGTSGAWVIRRGEQLHKLATEDASPRSFTSRRPRAVTLGEWKTARMTGHVDGTSQRFASLAGPQSLTRCGASTGYGWYRFTVKSGSSKKRLCHLPEASDRVHLFVDGALKHLVGVGPGADNQPFELSFTKGEHTIVAFVDNLGRYSEGNDVSLEKGLLNHLYEIKPIRSTKPKKVTAAAVDPFTLRGYIAYRAAGQMSDSQQVAWTFKHLRKTPILVQIDSARASGTFVLNDQPVAYYAGETGGCYDRLLISQDETDAFKRGNNVLRFAPDPRQDGALDEIIKATAIFECVDALSDTGAWSFAKWEQPIGTSFRAVAPKDARSYKGQPVWHKCRFNAPAAVHEDEGASLWLEVTGLSKGHAYVNGHGLGRYFTSTATGKSVGPQTRLYVPDAWIKPEQSNELVVFDEHGFSPHKVKLRLSYEG